MAPPPITTNPPVQAPFANEQEEQKALETLQTGQPEQVRQTVDGLTSEQTTQLQDEVGQLPVTQQRDLANNVAKAGLSAEQLAKVKPVVSEEVLDGAIAAYGSPETQANYKLTSSDPVERAQGELQKEVDKVTAARDQPGDGTSTSSASHDIDTANAANAAMAKYRDLALSLPPDQAARFVLETEQQLKTIGAGLGPSNVGDASARYGQRQDAFAAISRHVAGDGQAGRVDGVLAETIRGSGANGAGVPKVPAELSRLSSEVQSAVQAAKDKDKELATLLSRDGASGRMSDGELKQVIDHFRKQPGNAEVYAKVEEAQKNLGEYVSDNSAYLLALAKQPDGAAARTALLDGVDALAATGKETEAATLLDQKILSDPTLSQKLREENPDTFDRAMESAYAGAAAEIVKSLGEDGRNTESLIQAFESRYPNLLNNTFNTQAGSQGVSSFRDAFRALVNGDASGLPAIKDSPTTRALGAAGLVLGSANAGLHWQQGEYDKFVYDAGTAGAGVLTAVGKMSTKGVPLLGVVANGASIFDVITSENPNAGDALTLAGSVMGLVGSGMLIGGTTAGPGGAIIAGTGALIAGIGGIVSNKINEHKAENELRDLLRDSGIEAGRIDRIVDGDVTILAPGPGFGQGSTSPGADQPTPS